MFFSASVTYSLYANKELSSACTFTCISVHLQIPNCKEKWEFILKLPYQSIS